MNEHFVVTNEDPLAQELRTYAQQVLIFTLGFLPLFFIPNVQAPSEYSKILFALSGTLIAFVLLSLSILRAGNLNVRLSYTVVSMWIIVGVAFVSAFFSGDVRDALTGEIIGIHSTVFVAILALITTVWMLIGSTKATIMRLYLYLALSALVLVVFHAVRIFLGPEVLSFAVFTSTTATPVGGWNDLALFLGLTIILSLVALEQLTLTKRGRVLFGFVTACALLMLGVINFFVVWLVLGLTSLTVIVYTLRRKQLPGNSLTTEIQQSVAVPSFIMSAIVFVVSVLFIIGGSVIGSALSKYTGISYVEVRPSLEATIDIARSVYRENPFLGIGTNKFADAWKLYKEVGINETVFWNTDFVAGNSYISTFFVTTGVVGGGAWILFLVCFIYSGLRVLFTTQTTDKMWYFIGVSSFVSALYIWGMSLVYVPGAVVLMLGALCTGIALSSQAMLRTSTSPTFALSTDRHTGFILTLAVIIIIVSSVGSLYITGRLYAAAYTFNENNRVYGATNSVEQALPYLASAYELNPSDQYARSVASYNILIMNELLGRPAPTDVERQQFEAVVVNAINAAQQAVRIDDSESENWSVLGDIYSILVPTKLEGVYDHATEALTKSHDLNPQNPRTSLALALLEARAGKYDTARTYAESAIRIKRNYTDALYLVSQIDIVTGNIKGAVQSIQSMIALEPQNPARYYQLGILALAQNDVDAAISIFEKAITLDPSYANARYFLARAYDAKGKTNDAIIQLEKVLELNPENAEVTGLLQILHDGKSINKPVQNISNQADIVSESTPTQDENGVVSADSVPDSRLVDSVNVQSKQAPSEATTTATLGE